MIHYIIQHQHYTHTCIPKNALIHLKHILKVTLIYLYSANPIAQVIYSLILLYIKISKNLSNTKSDINKCIVHFRQLLRVDRCR